MPIPKDGSNFHIEGFIQFFWANIISITNYILRIYFCILERVISTWHIFDIKFKVKGIKVFKENC